MILRRAVILGCVGLVSLTRPGHAIDLHSLLGRAFVVKDPSGGVDPARRRVVATAKEKASVVALSVDPTADGAALAVETNALGQVLAMPASGWRATRDGFRYADHVGAFGAVKGAAIHRDAHGTFTMKVVLSGSIGMVVVVPPNPGTDGGFAFVFGNGETYCAHYGGVAGGLVTNDGARSFKVQRPTAIGPCPSSVLPTTPPTTSSTTSTSSTSTTTILGPPCGDVNGAPYCWGECPAATPLCADVGGTCQCISGTQPCDGMHGTTCDGACPAGEVCVSGAFDCACMPAGGTPCFDGTAGGSVCGGFCPPDESCLGVNVPGVFTGCLCVPPDCTAPGPFGACGLSCPAGRSCQVVPVGLGLACLCLP